MQILRYKKVHPDEKNIKIGDNTRTKIIDSGVAIETTIALFCNNTSCHIEKLDKDHYKVKRTGEIKEFKHTEKRTDNIASIAVSMKKLRDIINYNVQDISKVTWLTLTYKENMQDYNRLYDDYRKFNMRLRYYCKQNSLPSYEYIAVCEPQARGAWHMHVILLWDTKAPYIKNDVMASIWKNGFTKTTALKGNIDSLGYYLSAYLTDLPLEEAFNTSADFSTGVKTRNDKKYVKAARLALYPPGINFYRCSKGIKRPKAYYLSKHEADLMLEEREADLKRKTYTSIYEDNKINGFGMLAQHCYYDTRESARSIYRLKKAYYNSLYYRNLYSEMITIINDYLEDFPEEYNYTDIIEREIMM